MGKRRKKNLRKARSNAEDVRTPKAVGRASSGVSAKSKLVLGSSAIVIIGVISWLVFSISRKIDKTVQNGAEAKTNSLVGASRIATTNDPGQPKMAVVPAAATNSVNPGSDAELGTQYVNQGNQVLEQGNLD